MQEIFGLKGKIGAIIGTLATITVPFICVLIAPKGSWNDFWTLFGASNQLLAALTLLSITVWLYNARKRIAFTLLPMLFVLTITFWALGSLVVGNFRAANGFDVKFVNGAACLALISLAIYLIFAAIMKLRGERRGGELAVQNI